MNVGAIIQARMGSTRLPAKVMKKIAGKTVLEHVITRVRQSQSIHQIIIATTGNDLDDAIEAEALRCRVEVFRGSEEDVLSRYYEAAQKYNLDVIVRITSDCPLIDPHVLDQIIGFYLTNNYDIVSNAGVDPSSRTYPRGLDTEVFSFARLEEAFQLATEKYQREHVTPYIYERSTAIYYFKNDKDYSRYRWTLDTGEDLQMITEVYQNLFKSKHDFYLEEIISLFEQNPDLYAINAHIEQKNIKT